MILITKTDEISLINYVLVTMEGYWLSFEAKKFIKEIENLTIENLIIEFKREILKGLIRSAISK